MKMSETRAGLAHLIIQKYDVDLGKGHKIYTCKRIQEARNVFNRKVAFEHNHSLKCQRSKNNGI